MKGKVKTSRSHHELRKDIKKWLMRVGVNGSDIEVLTGVKGEGAKVSYVYNGKKFELTSFNQQDITNNLAALEILIHSRVLGIERDIETVEQAFSRFMLPENTDPYSILGLARGASMDVVEAVYKKLALTHHPDMGGIAKEFIRIKDAYETIKEERKGNES